MDYEKEYKRKALGPIVNYIESVMASYSKEELEARIKEALPKKESDGERIRRKMVEHFKSKTKETWCNIPVKNIIAYLEKKKEKPLTGIYWHAIKKGDTLPCRAYLWTANYEKYHDCFEGRLIPNMENVTVGADMWYLPVDDIRALPREGIDELPKEQKSADQGDKGRRGRLGGTPEHIRKKAESFLSKMESPYDADDICSAYEMGAMESIKQEWSEEDEKNLELVTDCIYEFYSDPVTKYKLKDWLKSLRPKLKMEDWTDEDSLAIKEIQNALQIYMINHCISEERRKKLARWLDIHCNAYPLPAKLYPHWKPTTEHLSALSDVLEESKGNRLAVLKDLYNHIKEL